METKTAVFGGGCFWCTEAVFKRLNGVIGITPGYAGGSDPHPTYETVCQGRTGHAEVVRIEYDPARITYEQLLTVFFATHDPTTLNRQGNDVGTQYRSIVLYMSEEERKAALALIDTLNAASKRGDPIVTTVLPLTTFYEAETYHHDYYAQHKDAPYCQVVINPKLEKVQAQFAQLLSHNQHIQ